MDFLNSLWNLSWTFFKWFFFPSTSNPIFYVVGLFVFGMIVIKLLFYILKGGVK